MIHVIGGTLHQWDVDRKIEVLNKNIAKLAFSNNQYCGCERYDVVNGMVAIPNKFLESHHDICVYGINKDGREIYSCELSINSKMKPDSYYHNDGEAGQFAVSDGKGGISWLTIEMASEVTF